VDELIHGTVGRLTVVICPRLSDPENLGSIARIADVLGVDLILAGDACPDPFSRRVLRVSMGSILRVPVIISEELDELAEVLTRDFQVELHAAVADQAAEPFDRAPRPERVGLVLGEEDQGLDAVWLKRCQRTITIPMRAGAGSLNVAVAAGILLYGLVRGSAGS
jgi:tRNA G18 (ribose-2'-O)-methylase SpoU